MAGQDGRLPKRGERSSPNSVSPGYARFPIESNSFYTKLELGRHWPSCRKSIFEIQAQEMQMFRGNVVSLYIARDAAVPMESAQEVKAIAGRGLEGDRYFNGIGHWSKTPGVGREVTL